MDSLNIAAIPLIKIFIYFLKNFGSASTISENVSIISSPYVWSANVTYKADYIILGIKS